MQKFNLKKGDKITQFSINGLGMASQSKMIVFKEQEERILFKFPRKRKLYGLKKEKAELLVRGHDLKINAQGEKCSVMNGNCILMFVSEMNNTEFHHYLDSIIINKPGEDILGLITNMTLEQGNDADFEMDNSNVVYPGIDIYGAPINEVKNRK